MGRSDDICHIWCTVVVTCSVAVSVMSSPRVNWKPLCKFVRVCVCAPHPFRCSCSCPALCVCMSAMCDPMQIHNPEIGSMHIIVGGVTSRATLTTIHAFFPTLPN